MAMTLYALTVFAAMLAVPCIIGLAQGRDTSTRILLGTAISVALLLGLSPFVDTIGDLLNGNLVRALGGIAAVLGVLVTVRIGNPVIATLTTTGGLLLAMEAFGALR